MLPTTAGALPVTSLPPPPEPWRPVRSLSTSALFTLEIAGKPEGELEALHNDLNCVVVEAALLELKEQAVSGNAVSQVEMTSLQVALAKVRLIKERRGVLASIQRALQPRNKSFDKQELMLGLFATVQYL